MQERSIIQKDFYRESGRWFSGIDIIKRCFSPNLHFVYLLRKAQKYQHTFLLKSIWKLILRHYQIKYGFQIYPETTIGEGFYLGHWGSLVINPKTVIGKNCNIAQGVTIGQQNRGKNAGAPTIGNHVWIGTNAVIVGNIKVGNDVLIAPNSYVNFNVPDHSIVSGNPATIVSRENATDGYINNVV